MRALPLCAASLLCLAACGGADDDSVTFPQHTDDPAIYTFTITDPAGDLVPAYAEAPPSIPSFPAVDVREVALGLTNGWFYLRFGFSGIIPTEKPVIDGEDVQRQGFNLSMNTDGDTGTGGSGEGISGIDVYYAVAFDYGKRPGAPYANYGVSSDVHVYAGQATGEFRSGGPGYDYVAFRFAAASLGAYLPRGTAVDVGGWSEAASANWHHFAFDSFAASVWNIP